MQRCDTIFQARADGGLGTVGGVGKSSKFWTYFEGKQVLPRLKDDRKREKLRFSSRATGKTKSPLSEMGKTERSRPGGRISISKLAWLNVRCLLGPMGIGNRIYRSAGQERDYGRAKTTKTKSPFSRLPVELLPQDPGRRGLSGGLEKFNTCAQNLGRKERKYGNLRARPQPQPRGAGGAGSGRGPRLQREGYLYPEGRSGEAGTSQGSARSRGGAGAAGSGADLL